MDIGIGLPISDPARLGEWARRAEAAGFDTLALLDRLAFDNPEPLLTLAHLAGITTRVTLQTEVLLGPLRGTALLAKQAATLDVLSDRRFRLGIGIGGRSDDHQAAGTPLKQRGTHLDRQLTDLKRIWNHQPYIAHTADPGASDHDVPCIGPAPLTPGGPPILIGGFAPRALARVAAHADGFICAAGPDWAPPLIEQVRGQWRAAGRAGRPRIVCQVNTALGPREDIDEARAAIAAYYAFTGRPGWGTPVTDARELRDIVAAYHAMGADEVVLYHYATNPDQIEHLAELDLGR